MSEPTTRWVRAAHADAWQTLAVTTERLPGVRLSATGLPHPQWNNGDVDDPAVVDIEAVRTWYDALGVPWGMRVPSDAAWPHGRFLFRKRLMGVTPKLFVAAESVAGGVVRPADREDFDDVLRVDTVAFDESPAVERPWLELLAAHPAVTVAVAELDGEIVGTGSVTTTQDSAGPAGYVAGIAVAPTARRRGVGAALTSWLTSHAFDTGAALCHLHPDTDAAAGIYRRLGFVEVDGLDIYVDL